MSAEFEKAVEDLAATRAELADLEETLSQLPVHAHNRKELEELKDGLGEMIPILEIDVETKRSAAAAPTSKSTPLPTASTPSEVPKWSRENHPAFQNKPVQPVMPEIPAVAQHFQMKEKVLARYKGSFAPAVIMQILGSSANPKYYVKYDGYQEYATLDSDQVKRIESRKRKVDTSTVPTTISTAGSSVISAAASINLALADQVKRIPSKVSDGPTRPARLPKKVKTQKKLEEGKSKWKQFSTSQMGKGKKDSMFRTGDGVNARVGFTGSGQAMRKDGPRSKHVYQPTENEDEEEEV